MENKKNPNGFSEITPNMSFQDFQNWVLKHAAAALSIPSDMFAEKWVWNGHRYVKKLGFGSEHSIKIH